MKKYIVIALSVLLLISAASCDIRVNGENSGPVSESGSDAYTEYPDTVPDDYIKSGSNDMFEYDIYGRHAEITKYIGSKINVTVPQGIENKKVTVIGEKAFEDKDSLKEVHIPPTVEKICAKAFYRCYFLEKVTGCENVFSIGDYAFAYDGRMTEFTFGEKLLSVGDKAFMWCESIDKIFIPASCNTIGDKAFLCCVGATELTFEDGQLATVGEEAFMCLYSVESICYPYISITAGDGIFKHSQGLKNITFDRRVSKVSKTAFQNSHAIETVTLPEQITFIGDYAFGSCHALKEITVENADLLFGCSRDTSGKNKHLDVWFHAFLQIEGLTIRGRAGSTAEELAKCDYGVRNGWTFEKITE